jgi:predicted nucleic acid-binding protein
VYTADTKIPAKQAAARKLLADLLREGHRCVISTQILQEFYSVVARKLGVAAAEAANCGEILTENMQHGRSLRGIKIRNPFKKK